MSLRVLVCDDPLIVSQSIRQGQADAPDIVVMGYLNKRAYSEQMIKAVRKVAKGQLFITPSVGEQLAGAVGAGSGLERGQGDVTDETPLTERLSHREYQVFRLLATGRSVGDIAEQLVLSPNTVSTYRTRILKKTGVRNDVELALCAVRVEVG